ncbi:hypothetical protein MHU86_6896 [Fragilaria crotonensis]|nr:hypothetical protein MHU86_6896 [Fragilaria crotonensis]
MGGAKVPVDYIVCPEWDSDDELFLEDNEMQQYQMPLTGDFNKAVEFLAGLIAHIHASAQLDNASSHAGNKRDTSVLREQTINGAAAVERNKVVAAPANVPAVAVDKAVVEAVGAVAINFARKRTMLILPTLIGTLRPMNGNGSDHQCDHTSCNCKKAVVDVADEVTVIKTTVTPIGRPAVLRRTTITTTAILTTAVTGITSQPTIPLFQRSQS